jgi:CRP-like cAMP-binding protein
MDEFIAQLAPVASRKLFKRHSILLYQGEAPRTAFVILSGALKVYSINTAGEEQVVNFHMQHDILPTSWIFKRSSTTLYYYEALTDCEVLAVPRSDLMQVISSKPEYMHLMMDYFAANYVGMLVRVTALEQSRAREKIMFTLYYLLFRYGREVKPGTFVIELSLTHTVIASLVGLTRETTTTELSKLKRQKVLKYSLHTYTLDKQKLERLLGEDSFQNLAI